MSDDVDIYYTLNEARYEIWKRWNNKNLRQEINKYLKKDIPSFLQHQPKAILARNVATPNNELFQFIELSKVVDLEPLCLEYSEDIFTSNNIDKYHLGKICVDGESNCKKIIDFSRWEHKIIADIRTKWDQNLVDFHHEMLINLIPSFSNNHYDMSDWVRRNGNVAESFYPIFLGLFICHGILFEDLITSENEQEFANRVIIPSITRLNELFGLRPLIVQLKTDSSKVHASHYTNLIYKFLKTD